MHVKGLEGQIVSKKMYRNCFLYLYSFQCLIQHLSSSKCSIKMWCIKILLLMCSQYLMYVELLFFISGDDPVNAISKYFSESFLSFQLHPNSGFHNLLHKLLQ